jgi:hypothetical protein
MKIQTELQLDNSETKQLAGIINVKPNQLEKGLEPFARAAIQEYVQMFLGQKVFTRGSDTREFRLFLLIREAFGNKIPNEQKVCDLFQCSTTQARSLIRSVMSKYQYDLHEAIEVTLSETVRRVALDNQGALTVVINSENLVDALNRDLASIDGSLPQVAKKKNTVSTYELQNSSYLRLCDHYEIQPIQIVNQ